jgi:hypothetical protein
MAGTQVQFRRGTTAEHASFTGAVGEVTVDTTKDTLVVHDGSTAGGFPMQPQNKTGTVLQVVEGRKTTNTATTSTTPSASGLSASITPSSTSSKIYVHAWFEFTTADTDSASAAGGAVLKRGSTTISQHWVDMEFGGATSTRLETPTSISLLDAPATTSATTYSVDIYSYVSGNSSSMKGNAEYPATIILMEIAG